MHLCELDNLTMRLAPCWDGEVDPIGAFSQLAYPHEKAERAEEAARHIREAFERRRVGSGPTQEVARRDRPERRESSGARRLDALGGGVPR
jgi:hypothetical protein